MQNRFTDCINVLHYTTVRCSQKATLVLRKQPDVAKDDRFVVAPSQDHSQVHPASAVSGRASSSFTSAGAARSIRRPRSPAEPHPPSLAWVDTPLPLGPLPHPPGPSSAKHCKRALGAVFKWYSQTRPISPELASARVLAVCRPFSHLARTSRPVPASHDKI